MNEPQPIPREMLASLGIDAAGPLVEIGRAHEPEGATGHGLSVNPALAALALVEILQGPIRESPAFSKTKIAPVEQGVIEVDRWQREPGIAVVHCPEAVVVSAAGGPSERVADGDLAVDARNGPVYVRIDSAGGSRVVVIDGSDTAAYQVTLPDSPELQALHAWRPAVAKAVQVPALAMILDEASAPAWLREQVSHRLAIAAPLSVVAAYGLAARLSPPTHGSLDELLAMPPPAEKGANWVLQLSPGEQADLVARALDEADSLEGELEPLAHDFAHRAEGVRERARALLHRRDDLQSVSFILKAAGVGTESLDEALEQFDASASTWQSMWSACEPFDDDDRLLEVSWQEPDHWWGLLALE